MSVKLLWLSLFAVLALSFGLLVLHGLGIAGELWHLYYTVYLVSAIGHTWYIFLLLAKEDLFPRQYAQYNGEKIAVIIPCFNEDPALLERALTSVLRAKGNKSIFVIDDGSTNEIDKVLFTYAYRYGIRPRVFYQNKGKRDALYHAITHFIKDADYVVTMDSDTVFDAYALVRLAEALKTGKIGGASGDVRLLNENENLLTRMTGAYYWTALHLQRRAQSGLGMVACCSGALAGYRSAILKTVIESFVHQQFLGERCTHSEDRHLTNLILKSGYDVVFVPEAVAYTYSPTSYRAFLRQQLRWRRGFIKEALWSLTFMWRVKPILFFEIFFWELILPFLSFGIMLLVCLNIFLDPRFIILVLVPSLLTITVIRHLPVLFYAPRKLYGLMCFTFFSLFVMYWQGFYALFTVRNKSWITR
jgi:hyaluronan synthase